MSRKVNLGKVVGEDGYSPSAKVTQTEYGAKIEITDAEGTTTAIIQHGSGSGSGGGGIAVETDPVYIKDKPKIALKSEIPTNLSELSNDTGFITSNDIPAIPTKTSELTNDSSFATETYVKNEIANAQLGGDGGDIDLSGYATKDELNNKVDKVTGKSLIADSEITRLSSVTNYDDTEIRNELNKKANISDIPTIPTKLSEFDNDSGFITDYTETDPIYTSEKSTLALKSELPTKLSQLQNDSEFINKTVSNLTNYYTKTETYTKTEVNNLIGGLGSLDLEIVESLPTIGDENKIYLLAQNREAPDIYDEYLYINGWEKIGSTAVDLTNYYTKAEVDNLIPEVPTKISELENDSGFITEYNETDPTVPSHVKSITETDITNWNNKAETSDIPDISTKQDTLVSGTNIKTINGQSILGSGNITIEGGSGSSITLDIEMSDTSENAVQNKVIKAYVDGVTPKLVTLTQNEYDALVSAGNVDENTYYFIKEE